MFIKVSDREKRKMYQEGGNRERQIMENSTCCTTALGRKDCIKFHDKKHKKTAIYRKGHGWVN